MTPGDGPGRGGHRRRCLAAAALCVALSAGLQGAAAPLAAQEAGADEDVPDAEPGAVVTVPVSVPPPEGVGAEAPRYRVDGSDDVRLFGSGEGTAELAGGRALLPVTFQLSRRARAGVRAVATVTFRWPEGRTRRVPVRVRVPARYSLQAEVGGRFGTVAPGASAEVAVSVSNLGNATDSVYIRGVVDDPAWRLASTSRGVVLEPGETEVVRVEVRAPAEVRVGQSRRVRFHAAGRGDRASADILLRVVESSGWIAGVEHLPGRLFLGTTTGRGDDGSASVLAALHAQGTVGSGTEVSLQGRLRPAGDLTPLPFREEATGPTARLVVRRAGWRVGLGDIFARASPLAGTFQAGRGLDVSWEGERYSAELFVARPSSQVGDDGGGHSVLAQGGVEVDETLRFGLTMSDQEQELGHPGETGRTQGAGGYFELTPDPRQQLRVEAGLMRLMPDSGGATTGPAAELQYRLSREEGSLTLRARGVPGRFGVGPTQGDEVLMAGRRRIHGPLHAVGLAQYASAAPLKPEPESRSREVSAGLEYLSAALRLEGRLRYREVEGVGSVGGERRRRTAVLSADAPVGPLELDARLELGEERGLRPDDSGYRHLRAGARWYGEDGWLWLTAGEERVPDFPTRRFAELQGGADMDRVAVSGGAGYHRESEGGGQARLWSRLAYRLGEDLSVVAGLERRPTALRGDDWSLSLGVEKGLDLPLPLPAGPVVRGVVFEDLDADGVRDPGEPPVPGVRIRKGFVERVTDSRGRFEIHQEAVRHSQLEVVAASLPQAAVVSPGADIAPEGDVEIPVLRLATLQLHLFHDEDGDGVRGSSDGSPREAVITLVDSHGRRRRAEADESGRVRMTGLPPGRYRVEIRVPADGRRRPAEKEIQVELVPGAGTTRTVALPPARRPVKF